MTQDKQASSPIHGGNIYEAAMDVDIPENEILDFSASINPLGISDRVKDVINSELDSLANYPDPDNSELTSKIASHHGINTDTIICGNGSTELIYLIPRVFQPRKVLITAPAFSEYEKACILSKESRVMSYELKESKGFAIVALEFIEAMQDCDMAFLCNPNNPTGRVLHKNEVLEIADTARKLKCILIIDEAFIDFIPKYSVVKEVASNPYLIVLRSMTKFYALTGLRIGYGVFNEDIVEKVNTFKEPWTVNSLAQKAALAALGDSGYAKETMELMGQEKEFFEDAFKDLGIEFIASAVNFYLLKINQAKIISLALKQKGILVRDCSNFQGLDNSYIRVAVKSSRDNQKLIKELSNLCKK